MFLVSLVLINNITHCSVYLVDVIILIYTCVCDDFLSTYLFVVLFLVQEGQVIRVSFSNMFKEFKSTATWLQFPFLCGAAHGSVFENTACTAKQGISNFLAFIMMFSTCSKHFL